jgi:competence protein ComEC
VNKLLIFLAILLYLLIYYLRLQQGGWEGKVEVFNDLRANLDRQIALYLPSPQAELLSGILLGQNKDLPGQLRLALRDTSTLHIVVASGQNLSMLAGFFLGLAGLLKRRTVILLSFLAIIFYCLLTGFQIPILRAAIMVSLGFLAQILGREKDTVWILILTCALMLLINPNWIGELSFQLSVLATFGVVVVAPLFAERIKFIPDIIRSDLAVSLGAQMMVMPIIAANFHQVSLVGLFTNILVLWTIPLIMILGGSLLLFSALLPPIANLISWLVGALLQYFLYIVEFFSSMPFAWEYVGEYSWVFWVGYYLLVAGFLKFLDLKPNKNKKN